MNKDHISLRAINKLVFSNEYRLGDDMGLLLVYDTETTGLVAHKLSHRHPAQPHLVQLGAVLVNSSTLEEVCVLDCIIHPRDRYDKIEVKAFEAHGISMDQAREEGIELKEALTLFNAMAGRAQRAICHNVAFDEKMMNVEYHRLDMPHEMPEDHFCTMEASTPICKLKGNWPGSYKWPKLEEALRILCNEELEGAHDAVVDLRAALKVYKYLVDHGHASY